MRVILENKRLKGLIVNREEKIVELCKNNSVLHLGCADYPYSVEQYRTGKLLHEKLKKVAKQLLGIDISQEGLDYLTSLGYSNLIKGDVEEIGKIEINEKFHIVVAGELFEHLSNPGKFFENVSTIMENDSIIIISVPNAHSLKGFIRVLFGRELLHPDHLTYFSPGTVEHLCKKYNYELLTYFYYLSESTNIIKSILFFPLKYFIQFFASTVADGIIFIIKKSKYE